MFLAAYNHIVLQVGRHYQQKQYRDLAASERWFRRLVEFNRYGKWHRVGAAGLVLTLIADERPLAEIQPLTARLGDYGTPDGAWSRMGTDALSGFATYGNALAGSTP